MAKQTIFVGDAPDDGTGDTSRNAFIKINENFTELYEFMASAITINPDAATHDAFARMRVSNPETLFDSKQIHNDGALFWDDQNISGTSNSVWTQYRASTVLQVQETTAGHHVRQTFRRFNYQPAKSQLVFITFNFNALGGGGGTGITQYAGLYDDDNGIFLMDDEGTIKLVRRSSRDNTNYPSSGSPTDYPVAQASWNIDTMDGNGSSGITLDFDSALILFMDLEWLGVGRVRCGFVIDGVPVYCHEFLWANANTGVYMSTPNLPVRYEIENDGTGSQTVLEAICCSVISEGGTQETGTTRNAYTAAISGLSSATTYAILGVRLKSTNFDGTVLHKKLSVITSSSNDKCQWLLIWNPTVAGTFTYANETDSIVQTAKGTSANTVSGGYIIDSGFFDTSSPVVEDIDSALKLGSSISGVMDQIVLCVRPITNNITVYGSMTWKEIS